MADAWFKAPNSVIRSITDHAYIVMWHNNDAYGKAKSRVMCQVVRANDSTLLSDPWVWMTSATDTGAKLALARQLGHSRKLYANTRFRVAVIAPGTHRNIATRIAP